MNHLAAASETVRSTGPEGSTEEIGLPPLHLPAGFIARPELVELLDAAAAGPLTVVVAPAGFGKSLLLQDWLSGDGARSTIWLPLDDRDDDGRRLAARLVAGLNGVDPGIGTQALERGDRSGSSLGEDFIACLVADLEVAEPAVLVVDAIEKLTDPFVRRDLLTLIDRAPSTLSVVLSTRSEPDRRWLTKPSTRLGQTELAFVHPRAAELLAHTSGRALSERQVDAVLERTEGWAAGLQLFGLALRGGGDIDDLIEDLSGTDAMTGEYLTEEVFARQPPSVRQFLLQTSVLQRLTPALCRAVTGDAHAGDLMRSVERASLFLVPAGDRADGTTWFRYQRLFHEWIRKELRIRMPDAERSLLRSAADWHLSQDDMVGAMGYLVEARDWDRVLDLTAGSARSLFEEGEAATALRWLRDVPETVRRSRAETLLVEALLLSLVGDSIQAEEVADALVDLRPPTPEELAVLNSMRVTWVQDHWDPERVLAAGRSVVDTLEAPSSSSYPDPLDLTSAEHLPVLVAVSCARARWYLGDSQRARDELTAVVEGSNDYGPWRMNALGALGLVALWDGRLQDADRIAVGALAEASRRGLSGHPSSVDALLAMASVSREHDQLGRADLLLEQGLALANGVRRAVPVAVHAVERAALDLAMMDPRGGLKRLAAFSEEAHASLQPNVAARLVAAEARLLLAIDDMDGATRALDAFPGAPTGEIEALRVQIALGSDDVVHAQQLLDAWAHDDVRSQIDLQLWSAVAASVGGGRERALQHMQAAVERAEPEGYLRLFLDAGPAVVGVLAQLQAEQPSPYVAHVLTKAAAPGPAISPRSTLSQRELAVLRYLPSRLSNAELAGELFISQNTVKSHLHRIYRHLGVPGRRQAVLEAERRGLL